MADHPRIRVDVRRYDGDVTRLEGAGAIAVVTTFRREDPAADALNDPPTVALRADTKLQLAVLLASVISAVEAIEPGLTLEAVRLSKLLNGSAPCIHRVLPPLPEGQL